MPQPIPEAEPWAADGGDVGVLLLHGFTSTPWSMRPVAEALAAHGFAVELPRLPGHGTRWQDLQHTRWPDWAGEAAGAYERLRHRTRAAVVLGQSLGGAIALHLAQTRQDVDGLVLVNPSVHQPHPLRPLLPLLKWVLPSLPGIGNDIAKEGQDERPYPRVPLRAVASLFEFHDLVRARLAVVRAPMVLLSSRVDHVVPAGNADLVLAGVGTGDVRRVWLERSYHVATLDHDAGTIVEETARFAERVCADARR